MNKKLLVFSTLIIAVLTFRPVDAGICEVSFAICWNNNPYEWGLGDDGAAWRNHYQDCVGDYENCNAPFDME